MSLVLPVFDGWIIISAIAYTRGIQILMIYLFDVIYLRWAAATCHRLNPYLSWRSPGVPWFIQVQAASSIPMVQLHTLCSSSLSGNALFQVVVKFHRSLACWSSWSMDFTPCPPYQNDWVPPPMRPTAAQPAALVPLFQQFQPLPVVPRLPRVPQAVASPDTVAIFQKASGEETQEWFSCPFFLLVCLYNQVVFLDVPPKSSSLSSCPKLQLRLVEFE